MKSDELVGASRGTEAAVCLAQQRGYLVNRREYNPAERAYRSWCRRQRRPIVVVTIHGKTVSGLLDFDSTEYLSPDARVGLVGDVLSDTGAKMVRQFFDECPSPRLRLHWSDIGSIRVQLTDVPIRDADALGAMLYAAATAGDPVRVCLDRVARGDSQGGA
jgi:hypothetical protein